MGPVSMKEGVSFSTAALTSPRISFSHGFADTQRHDNRHAALQEAHVATTDHFEFSVKNYAMKPADEIFCRGMLAPLSGQDGARKKVITLRDELLLEESEDVFSGFKSISCRWIERWGTRKNRKLGEEKSNRKN